MSIVGDALLLNATETTGVKLAKEETLWLAKLLDEGSIEKETGDDDSCDEPCSLAVGLNEGSRV